ncbi:MAG TPA: zinc ribbon domain-containing protein [Gemmatimonadales bacterium]|nr:zinc ribbon domain-containing protein [Gemmatimonadales bacterium]
MMTVPAETAEWNCTRCGTTNRKLVPAGTSRTTDRCEHCGARHVLMRGDRPVRWTARTPDKA